MNTRPARVPNVETDERRAARLQREAIIAEQRAFLDSFDLQVEELTVRDEADSVQHPGLAGRPIDK